MKRNMLVCLLLVLLTLTSCSGPPIGHEVCTSTEQYLKVNDFVADYLKNDAEMIFPETVDDDAQYCYMYDCAVLGDPSFMIYLRTCYSDSDAYAAEQEGLAAILPEKITIDGGAVMYADTGVFSAVRMLTDGELHDGAAFLFEAVITDSENRTMEYLLAWQQDNNAYHEMIKRFASAVPAHE